MTEVMFHFNAPDKVGHTCRLVRKALASGAKVVVTGEGALLRELDVALWTFAPLEFLPHCLDSGAPGVLAASPVVLAESALSAPHQHVLVNLGAAVPEGFERFERLIEVVTVQDEDRQQGRRRWKHYAERGYAIKGEDLGPKETR
ncbi:MAG TPA: DNA polymerase III subunit chi [Ramlibacter sp.]|nr:DNA polymerase III subunit chi [Ramlibacter sp.]